MGSLSTFVGAFHWILEIKPRIVAFLMAKRLDPPLVGVAQDDVAAVVAAVLAELGGWLAWHCRFSALTCECVRVLVVAGNVWGQVEKWGIEGREHVA